MIAIPFGWGYCLISKSLEAKPVTVEGAAPIAPSRVQKFSYIFPERAGRETPHGPHLSLEDEQEIILVRSACSSTPACAYHKQNQLLSS